jgi:hypothetical protein
LTLIRHFDFDIRHSLGILMKLTFSPKTFAARTFRAATLAGPAKFGPYLVADAQVAATGAVAGDRFYAGVTVGQDYHTGAAEGFCNA